MIIHWGTKGYVMMRIIYGYMGVVDKVLEIFGGLGGWSILKKLGVFKDIWNFSSFFGVFGIVNGAEGVHIKNPRWPNDRIFRLNFQFSELLFKSNNY